MRSEKKGGSRITARQLAACALMTAVICVCSWLSVPAPVPFTMQTFAIFAALFLLGGRLGGMSVAAYVLLGAVGLPVFSGFAGGIGRLLGPTGGYVMGFLLMPAVYRLLGRWSGGSRLRAALAAALGLSVCYATGTAWLLWGYTGGAGAISVGAALSMYVLPFLIPDAVKLFLAVWLAWAIKKRIK